MTIKTCSVAGSLTLGGIELNNSDVLGGVTVVQNGDLGPLGDAPDDTTYIENTSSGPLDYMVRIEPLFPDPAYSGAITDPIELHMRWSMETDFHTGTEGEAYLFLQYSNPTNASGDYYIGQFSHTWNSTIALPGTYDGATIYDAVIPFITRPAGTGSGFGVAGTTLEQCLNYLATGDCWFNVNELHVADAGFVRGRIHEAYLLVGVAATQAPPRRIYPRPTTRQYPPPRFPQITGGVGPAALL